MVVPFNLTFHKSSSLVVYTFQRRQIHFLFFSEYTPNTVHHYKVVPITLVALKTKMKSKKKKQQTK